MAYTQTQVIQAALEQLGACEIGQTAATEYSTLVSGRMNGLLADLYGRRITASLLASPFADNTFPHLVRIVAERNAPDFGRALDPKAVGASETELASVSRLSRSTTGITRAVLDQLAMWGASSLLTTVDATMIDDRIAALLSNLAARSIIYISSADDIPDEAFDPLSRYIAARLAPQQAPNGALQEAERDLIVLSSSDGAELPAEADYF